jgi:hypothetical protein
VCDTLICDTLVFDNLTCVTLNAVLLLIKREAPAPLAGYAVSVAGGIIRDKQKCHQAKSPLSVMLVW